MEGLRAIVGSGKTGPRQQSTARAVDPAPRLANRLSGHIASRAAFLHCSPCTSTASLHSVGLLRLCARRRCLAQPGRLGGWAYWYGKNFIVSLTISVVIQLVFDITRQWFATPARVALWKNWQRTVFFSGLPLLGVAFGWPLGVLLAGADVTVWFSNRASDNIIVGTVLMLVLSTIVIHHFFAIKVKQFEAERRATESQLRLLQAQSYLELLQARMADRLRFSISADEAARAQLLPPLLLLQPLVENAVVHGLEPSIDGDSVRVSARVVGAQLVLEVQDDGRGLDAPARRSGKPGAGMALDNIRQRLLARYGSDATLEVSAAHPGTLARITLPLQVTTS